MTPTTTLKLSLALLAVAGATWADAADRVRAHTEVLSADELEGRGPGTEGSRRARTYIAEQMRAAGLQPLDQHGFEQPFAIPELEDREANVVGWLAAESETTHSLLFTAHFDAYGIREVEGDDEIHNGAVDNAVGVAALLELARRFAARPAPRQNLIFVATAAEEGGLHGSRYYADHPLFPLAETTAVLNIDGFSVTGPREDFFVMPRQGVEFVDEVRHVAEGLGWIYAPPDWVDGMDRSFDTATFLARGVPALTLWTGDRLPGGQTASASPLGPIHSPRDEITDAWDWSGVEAHLDLYEALARDFLSRDDRSGIGVTEPGLFVPDDSASP